MRQEIWKSLNTCVVELRYSREVHSPAILSIHTTRSLPKWKSSRLHALGDPVDILEFGYALGCNAQQ